MKFESELPEDMRLLIEKWRHYVKFQKADHKSVEDVEE